jgi:hypothetical protein
VSLYFYWLVRGNPHIIMLAIKPNDQLLPKTRTTAHVRHAVQVLSRQIDYGFSWRGHDQVNVGVGAGVVGC